MVYSKNLIFKVGQRDARQKKDDSHSAYYRRLIAAAAFRLPPPLRAFLSAG
jgi:hypothetical protein